MKKRIGILLCCIWFLIVLFSCMTARAAEVVGREILFPEDEGPHAGYGLEWWYFSGHLKDDSGQSYGFMASFFKVEKTLVSTHFLMLSLTEEFKEQHHFTVIVDKNLADMVDSMLKSVLEKKPDNKYAQDFMKFINENRERVVFPEPVKLSKNWAKLKFGNNTFERIDEENMIYETHLEWDDFMLDLKFTSRKPPLIVGDKGVIDMGVGGKSYYYSLTRLDVDGSLSIRNQKLQVSGIAWFDHQWGNWDGEKDYRGWDWFSVQLENNMDFNLFCFRDNEGNIIAPVATVYDGTTKKVSRELSWTASSEWTSPKTGITYPQDWKVIIADMDITLDIRPTVPHQEFGMMASLGTIWEGSTVVQADIGGEKVSGVGYTELVGYGPRLVDMFELE